MRTKIISWTAAVCLQAGICSIAQAQLLEDVEMRLEGNDAIVQIRFVTPVQLQGTVSSRSGDLLQIFYGILPTSDRLNPVTSERRIRGRAGLPMIIITDDDAAFDGANRRLVVRFGETTRHRVRPGRDRQSIEIVLEGRGTRPGG